VSAATTGVSDPRTLVDRRFELSATVTERFFEASADAVSRTCVALAERFRRGGRLLVFGSGAQATDALHVSVEFVHPVLVGKRALPALALTADAAVVTDVGDGGGADAFDRAIAVLGRPEDMALGISRGSPGAAVARGLAAARARGMLTVALTGWAESVAGPAPTGRTMAAGGGTVEPAADFVFVVPSTDPLVVQEVQETLYHVFWELVHVFLDREGP
jgi:D-sedoheptulose 7-phosphate isomerase